MNTSRSNTGYAQQALSDAALAFLQRFPPFDRIERDIIAPVIGRMSLGYYSKDTAILGPAAGVPSWLYIVQRGSVHVRDLDSNFEGTVAELGEGECFSVGALLERRAVGSAYMAASDVFCYQLPIDDFQRLFAESARFRDFATDYLATLLRDSRRLLKMHVAGYAAEETLMNRPLRSLINRKPVSCTPDTPIQSALGAMQTARIGSILITNESGGLSGILTRHDVLDRIALQRRDLCDPVSSVMTPHPMTLGADETAYDAALLIAQCGIHHIPVTEAGKVLGIVTERDLFALQRASMRTVRREIADADDLPALRASASGIRALGRMLLERGVSSQQLTYIVSTLNDALTERLIEVTRREHSFPGVQWAWLAFGSEGRYEQTISTDQDNGLLFADQPGISGDEQRELLLPFARRVNEMLDACGFPLCKGNIMAANPEWCLSLSEWTAKFTSWVRHTDAAELLNSVIFFDMRAVCGDRLLTTPLLETRAVLLAERPVFLRQLAQYAVQSRPPLGLFGGFVDDDESAPGTIDLKKSAARIFTDAARVFALAAGVTHTNTAHRLRLSSASLRMSKGDVDSACEAFFFVQSLRLRMQMLGTDGVVRTAPNRLDPRRLNEVDRRMLKEAFRQARNLQARLAVDYQL